MESPVSRTAWSRWNPLALALLGVAAIACEKGTAPSPTPLAGLVRVEGSDSVGTPAPTPPANSGPGYVRGTVLGPSEPGSGNDSLATAPRVAGVVITAYPRVAPTTADTMGIGPMAAQVTTGADGKFQLPSVPAGEYIITFNPPADSPYGGVWTVGPIHERSHEYPFWVVLWRKP
jgi:hypothetical protein